MKIVALVKGSPVGPQNITDAMLEKLPQEFGITIHEVQRPDVIDWGLEAADKFRANGKTVHVFGNTRLDLIADDSNLDLHEKMLADPVTPEFPDDWTVENFPKIGAPYEVFMIPERKWIKSSGYQKVLMQSAEWQELITDYIAGLDCLDGYIFSPPKAAQYGMPFYKTVKGGYVPAIGKRMSYQMVNETAVEWWDAVEKLFWKFFYKLDIPIIYDAYKTHNTPRDWRYSKQITEVPDARHTQATFYESMNGMIKASAGHWIGTMGPKSVQQRIDDYGKFNVPDRFQYLNEEWTIGHVDIR